MDANSKRSISLCAFRCLRQHLFSTSSMNPRIAAGFGTAQVSLSEFEPQQRSCGNGEQVLEKEPLRSLLSFLSRGRDNDEGLLRIRNGGVLDGLETPQQRLVCGKENNCLHPGVRGFVVSTVVDAQFRCFPVVDQSEGAFMMPSSFFPTGVFDTEEALHRIFGECTTQNLAVVHDADNVDPNGSKHMKLFSKGGFTSHVVRSLRASEAMKLPMLEQLHIPMEASSVKKKRRKKMNKHKQRKLRKRDRHRK